uniref:Uncharacterized protein n=1 Tax=Cacopsylla melanoneura TaxID=428564 RepID=A0A8D8Q9X4_9HEMI
MTGHSRTTVVPVEFLFLVKRECSLTHRRPRPRVNMCSHDRVTPWDRVTPYVHHYTCVHKRLKQNRLKIIMNKRRLNSCAQVNTRETVLVCTCFLYAMFSIRQPRDPSRFFLYAKIRNKN